MTNAIVTVNVSQQVPPAPSKLQRTGAILTQGGTNTALGTLSLITEAADLPPILEAAQVVTLAQVAGVATGTVSGGHGWGVGDVVPVVITGAAQSAYNGTHTATITSTTAFTFTIASGTTSPATGTITVLLGSEAELLNAVTEFFAQGSGISVYVLELGEGTVDEGVAYLTTWLTANNPSPVYSFAVPAEWDNNAAFRALQLTKNTTTSRLYFFTLTTVATYTAILANKCVFAMVNAPAAPATELSPIAAWWVTLNYNPGGVGLVTPLPFSYLQDVTAYPLQGTSATLALLKAANVNYVDTGAEGGITNTILKWGRLMDGNQWGYWYSVDWIAINTQLRLANAVINGANNPLAPLLYNQQGINYLQSVAAQTANDGVSFGLGNGVVVTTQLSSTQFAQNVADGLYRGQIVINAVPFLTYAEANPSDYPAGIYGGFSVAWIPQLGFEQIIVDIQATTFL